MNTKDKLFLKAAHKIFDLRQTMKFGKLMPSSINANIYLLMSTVKTLKKVVNYFKCYQ